MKRVGQLFQNILPGAGLMIHSCSPHCSLTMSGTAVLLGPGSLRPWRTHPIPGCPSHPLSGAVPAERYPQASRVIHPRFSAMQLHRQGVACSWGMVLSGTVGPKLPQPHKAVVENHFLFGLFSPLSNTGRCLFSGYLLQFLKSHNEDSILPGMASCLDYQLFNSQWKTFNDFTI